jgi:hypothetical protein
LTVGPSRLTRVDMIGNKHYALLDEIVENAGDDLFADQGVSAAVERLGKMGRLFRAQGGATPPPPASRQRASRRTRPG